MPLNDPVLPERANVFDVGVVQKIYAIPGLEVGVDGYYKQARDLLDDGQFGAAYVLNGFNYDRGENHRGSNSKRPTPTAISAPTATSPGPSRSAPTSYRTSFCSLRRTDLYREPLYLSPIMPRVLTGSAGASYLWNGTRFSASMIYGSGLRSGFANTDHVPSYTQVNVGISHEFNIVAPNKPTTLRFDVVNLFDKIYEIRDGSGIGVFAPQFGPRRGFFVGVTQKL